MAAVNPPLTCPFCGAKPGVPCDCDTDVRIDLSSDYAQQPWSRQ